MVHTIGIENLPDFVVLEPETCKVEEHVVVLCDMCTKAEGERTEDATRYCIVCETKLCNEHIKVRFRYLQLQITASGSFRKQLSATSCSIVSPRPDSRFALTVSKLKSSLYL